METEKMITSEVGTLRLEVNDDGEYIMISADDATMFDRFAAGIRHIVEDGKKGGRGRKAVRGTGGL